MTSLHLVGIAGLGYGCLKTEFILTKALYKVRRKDPTFLPCSPSVFSPYRVTFRTSPSPAKDRNKIGSSGKHARHSGCACQLRDSSAFISTCELLAFKIWCPCLQVLTQIPDGCLGSAWGFPIVSPRSQTNAQTV